MPMSGFLPSQEERSANSNRLSGLDKKKKAEKLPPFCIGFC
jgi:hypothetical protein